MITDCAVYEQGKRRPGKLPLADAGEQCDKSGQFVWIGLVDPTPEEFNELTAEFRLHPLAVEDALKPHQRPKLEVYDGVLFMVLRTARYVDPTEVIEFGQIMVFVGPGFVITIRHGQAAALSGVRQDLEQRSEHLRLGPGVVLHAVLDKVVDDYLPVLIGVDNDIREIEQEVFTPDGTSSAERIYRLKREVLEFHRAAAPLVDPLTRLTRAEYEVVHGDARDYFRDVQDHLLRVIEEVNGFNSLLTSMLDANLAQVTMQQNQDMRRISAWVAMLAVPTMVAGIYGMNFEHMPELKWRIGYPLVMVVMATICLIMFLRFRASGWLEPGRKAARRPTSRAAVRARRRIMIQTPKSTAHQPSQLPKRVEGVTKEAPGASEPQASANLDTRSSLPD
jgi:magnesium transporter